MSGNAAATDLIEHEIDDLMRVDCGTPRHASVIPWSCKADHDKLSRR